MDLYIKDDIPVGLKISLNPWFITGLSDGFFKGALDGKKIYFIFNRGAPSGIQQFSTNLRNCTNNHLSLVIWGTNLPSLVGRGRLTKQESNMIKFPPYQMSVIIGLLLSDGWLIIASKTTKNARLGFAQSADN